MGERNRDSKNITPTTREVTPDRPPSAIPLALSIYVDMVELPSIAPQVVPIASLIIASLTCGMLPSSRTIPVFSANPISVPMVSKIFTISRENTTRNVLRFNKPEKSNLQKIGDISCGAETGNQWSGNTVTPNGIPINVVAIMPQNNEPLTLRAISTPLSKVAKIPNKHGVVNSPNPTNVPSFATIMPAFLSPIKAINIPIPAEIA